MPPDVRVKKNNYFRRVWKETTDISLCSIALTYFESRALSITKEQLEHLSGHLRWHARSHSIVAKVSDIHGAIQGIHCTKIDGYAPKVVRRRCHGTMKHGAIHLTPPGPFIAIAEGIETALSFQEMHAIPTWSCISAIGIRNFIPPRGVLVDVAVDFDGTSITAYETFKRAHPQCCTGLPFVPKDYGTDWNDELQLKKYLDVND